VAKFEIQFCICPKELRKSTKNSFRIASLGLIFESGTSLIPSDITNVHRTKDLTWTSRSEDTASSRVQDQTSLVLLKANLSNFEAVPSPCSNEIKNA
jgi:hypothetical protein